MNKKPKERISVLKTNFYVLKFVFRFCPGFVLAAIFYIIARVASSLAEVNIIAKAIKLVINGADKIILFGNLIIYGIVILLCNLVIIIYGRFLENKYRMIYRKKIQTFLFSKVKHIDMASYDDPEFYDRFSRALRDGVWRGLQVFSMLVYFIESVAVAIALGTYVFITDYLLVIIILVSAVISFFALNYVNKIWFQLYRDSERAMRYQYYVRRTFYQQKYAAEIKTTPIGGLLIDRHEKAVDEVIRLRTKANKKIILPDCTLHFSKTIIQQALSYIYLAYKLFNGLGVDIFTSTINATFRLYNNLTSAVNAYSSLREASRYINDFMWITKYEPQIEKQSGEIVDGFEKLEIKDISFKYPKAENNSINHLSMTLKKGEKIAIVGDNGGGKTTLTKLLLHFYNPSDGKILLNGKDLKEYNEKSLRDNYSIVYQDFQIYALSIAENVLLHKVRGEEDEEIVRKALDNVGLLDKVLSFEKGIYTQVTREFDKDGANFSGGETQRLIIARVFASNANVYILDEPTSALDPFSEEKINKLIMQNVTDKTMIIIAHRLSTVVDADKIYLIRNGTITEEGTHSYLMNKKGRYYEMFTTQKELYLKKE